VAVDDELSCLAGREREALQESEGLQAPRQDRFDVQGEDVVQGRALQGEEAQAAEPVEQLLPLPFRLRVARADPRL
jgi:hypothetical protein